MTQGHQLPFQRWKCIHCGAAFYGDGGWRGVTCTPKESQPAPAAVDLTPWVQHKPECWRLLSPYRCTCGLDEALSGGLDTVLQSQQETT